MTVTCGNRFFWSMYDGELIIYPKAGTSATVEITGLLHPNKYTENDLNKEMVKEVTDADAEVQGLSDDQLKLVRYRVMTRLLEDIQQFDKADRMESRAIRIEREMRISHADSGYTDSDGQVRSSNG